MIAGVLLRNYKNYNNINFIPICNNVEYKFTAYIGNNGVGKSAILEALDVFINDRDWNISSGAKGSEAYICLMFLIDKEKVLTKGARRVFDAVSEYFWNADKSINPNFNTNPELKKMLYFRDCLKKDYESNHYLVIIGTRYVALKEAYFATFEDDIKRKLIEKSVCDEGEFEKVGSELMQYIKGLYSYIYIPVESSPHELLQIQSYTMQKLLNKDLLDEIENILNKTYEGTSSIVKQINDRLGSFINEVNSIINQVDKNYEFKHDHRHKKNLSSKDIREKILEAFFPLRTLKAGKMSISQLSSGEQRKAIIDVAYSILVSNGDKKTDKEIVLGIDEPESSMHISNCFNHFQRLEKLAGDYGKQIIITTHWYGFLPIAQNGAMHYIEYNEEGKREIHTFSLFNYMEEQRYFPDVIELKSMFDLATSIITYMRTDKETSWIVCEGSTDKLYLECILDGIKKINILPMGGCGNVIKLYRIIYSSLTEKNEKNDGNALFLIDTDKTLMSSVEIMNFSKREVNISLKRLQVCNGEPKLLDFDKRDIYEQTEIEDCLIPNIYFQALKNVIYKTDNHLLKKTINDFEVRVDAKNSMLRNDGTCLKPKNVEAIDNKNVLVEFAEKDENKKMIAKEYCAIYRKLQNKQKHSLCNIMLETLKIDRK